MGTVEIQFHTLTKQIFYFYHNLDKILVFFYDNEYDLDFWSSNLEHDLDRMDGAALWIKDYKDYYIMKFYVDFVTNKNNLDISLLCDLDFVQVHYYDGEIVDEGEEVAITFGGDETWD